MPRFVLLEHAGAPDDPAGLHWDLLLEAGGSCRTWRLARVPVCGGDAVPAEEIAPHRLAWLDHEAGEVSGGRGFARRVDGGSFEAIGGSDTGVEAARRVVVHVHGASFAGLLALARGESAWTARLVAAASRQSLTG